MKLFASFSLTIIISFALFLPFSYAGTDTLTIIHVNDTHSNLSSYGNGKYGGIARAASVIGEWKMTNPNPIFLHSGDFSVGTLLYNSYFGVPELQILNSLGCDALLLGNHEFDLTPSTLAGVLYQSNIDSTFNIISTNAFNLDSIPELSPFVKSSATIIRGNVKIGIIGITTPATNIESNPYPVFIDTNIVQDALQKAGELRSNGCQVVILMSHLGLGFDMQIAEYLNGIDAIIGGHSHSVVDSVIYVNNIPIVQAGEYYRYVGKLRLVFDGTQTSVLDYQLQEITDEIPAEPTIHETINQLEQSIASTYAPTLGNPFTGIGSTDTLMYYNPLTIQQIPTPIGSFFTNAMLHDRSIAHADFALEPTGHFADQLYPGSFTPADIFRVYPYGYDTTDALGFRLATYQLSGEELFGALQALLTFVYPELGDYQYTMQSTGFTYTIDTTGGVLNFNPLMVNDRPFHPESTYTIVSSDRVIGYMINLFGLSPRNITIYPKSVVQAVIESMSPTSVQEDNIATGFQIFQNYPNPFNPSTTIRYSLEHPATVTITLYNIVGQEIATLLNRVDATSGDHLLTFQASNLASGVYLYRMNITEQNGRFSSSSFMKMVVLK